MRNGCVAYIYVVGSRPRPVFRYPGGMPLINRTHTGAPWVPQEHHQNQSQPHQPGGTLKAQQPSPSRPVFYALCPSVIDFRHIHNISLSKVRHIARKSPLNATKYLFCCVRSFSCLFGSRICSTKADIDLYGPGVLCVLIGVSDTVSVVLFHQKNSS